MNYLLNLVREHYEWIFSGVGVFIIAIILNHLRKSNTSMKQNVSNNSIGIQSKKDVYYQGDTRK